MIRAAILGNPASWHIQRLTTAFQRRGVSPVYADASQFSARLGNDSTVAGGQISLSGMDLLIVREVPGGSLEQVIFRMDAIHQLENGGVRVVNSPYAIEKMVDKYYTLSLLQDAGLKVPRTLVTESFAEAMQAYGELGGDVVVKPLFGSRGVGMVRVSDEETAGRVFKALQLGGYVYYLQEFIPHANRDMRVFVIGDECITGMQRVAEQWKTNVAAGARPEPLELTPEITTTSRKAFIAVGADYCGVDLMYSESGELYVIEVNSMPAWQGLQEVTPFDIAGRLVDHCLGLVGSV